MPKRYTVSDSEEAIDKANQQEDKDATSEDSESAPE